MFDWCDSQIILPHIRVEVTAAPCTTARNAVPSTNAVPTSRVMTNSNRQASVYNHIPNPSLTHTVFSLSNYSSHTTLLGVVAKNIPIIHHPPRSRRLRRHANSRSTDCREIATQMKNGEFPHDDVLAFNVHQNSTSHFPTLTMGNGGTCHAYSSVQEKTSVKHDNIMRA